MKISDLVQHPRFYQTIAEKPHLARNPDALAVALNLEPPAEDRGYKGARYYRQLIPRTGKTT